MNDAILQKALAWAKKKGFQGIKAQSESYESPVAFKKPGEDDPIVPTITGVIHGKKSYIEIAAKDDGEKEILVSKWKLFSYLASRNGGKLYLLAAKGHKAFAERVVRDHNLSSVQIVQI